MMFNIDEAAATRLGSPPFDRRVVSVSLYHLFYAAIYRAAYLPSKHTPWMLIGYSAHPIGFFSVVALWFGCFLFLAWFMYLLVLGLLAELRYFRARETRPPMDDAIREKFDPEADAANPPQPYGSSSVSQ